MYASSGSMKCFECDDVGHKRSSYPHKQSSCHPAQATGCAVNSGLQVAQQSMEEAETGTSHHDLITNTKNFGGKWSGYREDIW